MARKLPVIYA